MELTAKQRSNNTNLKPFAKGQSGNPNGRPKKEKCFGDNARELLQATELHIELTLASGKKKVIGLTSTKNFYHGLVGALIVEGLQGNVQAIKELIDRADGKVPDKIDMNAHMHDERGAQVDEFMNKLDPETRKKVLDASKSG